VNIKELSDEELMQDIKARQEWWAEFIAENRRRVEERERA